MGAACPRCGTGGADTGKGSLLLKAVYFSPNDTTRRVTEAAAAAMEPGGERVDLLKAPLTEDVSVGAEEMLVVGMPVYAGRIPALCLSSLAHLKGQGGPAAAIAVYGNRDYDDALLELTDLLEAQGFRVVGAGAFIARHSIFPTVAADRPDEKDMAAIAAFGRECQARRGLFSDGHPGEILVKGSRPYKKPGSASFRPAGDKSCTACGACAAICPTHSIDPADPTVTSGDACIACAACIRVCPAGSRAFRGAAYHAARKAFELKCAPYRLPETFYRA